MRAGDNTLNLQTALQTLKVMTLVDPTGTMNPKELRQSVMENYVQFMTTPGTHNDTYAESFHRSFFKAWADQTNPPKTGRDIVRFAEERFTQVTLATEDHQLPVIGGLVLTIPYVLHYAHKSIDECAANTVEAIKLTHPAPSLLPYVDLYARLLYSVLHGEDLQIQVLKIASAMGKRNLTKTIQSFSQEANKFSKGSEDRLRYYQEATDVLGMACYIEGAMSSMLLLAYDFHDDFDNGILTNANCGGENVHRGTVLGALLGARTVYNGKEINSKWKTGLNNCLQNLKDVSVARSSRVAAEL